MKHSTEDAIDAIADLAAEIPQLPQALVNVKGVDKNNVDHPQVAAEVAAAGTVVWNGPMGMFEVAEFGAGTVELAQVAARAADGGATVVLGGGDSAAAAEAAGVTARMTHVSTGGGAALEFLSGAELPGVEALSDRTPPSLRGDER